MTRWLRYGLRKGHPVLALLYKWYSSYSHDFQYNGIQIRVLPKVFHPGLFISTNLLIEYLSERSLNDQSFLELGCGTGLISIVAARNGAKVWASDIVPRALENGKLNAINNSVQIDFIHSDLFDAIDRKFDWIVINPPYYPKDPLNPDQAAWFCGANFEFFQKLFSQLAGNSKPNTQVLMVLSEDCDLASINSIAGQYQWELVEVTHKKVKGEVNYVYSVHSASSGS